MNSIRLVAAILFVTCLVVLRPALAVSVAGLYEAEVPVDSQSVKERERAIRRGLEQVVERITGQVPPEQQESVREVVASAASVLQQYRFDVVKEGPEAGRIFLWMLFDGRNVERLLTENGLAVWGDERPETLLWLAIDDGQRRLLAADAVDELRQAVTFAERRYGLPMIVPIMDLEDRAAIGFSEVWGDFRERIMDASQRYGARSILLGRLSRAGRGWQARWSHVLPDGESQMSEFAPTAAQVMASGVALAQRRLAERFASSGGAGEVVASELVVDGVGSLERYARVTRYLSRMPLVKAWSMRSVQGERLLFDVQLKGGAGAFRRAVTLDAVIVDAGGAAGVGGPLVYRLAQ